ncbi:MAG TPA: hypothetical protein VNZ67_13910 [bacterium]|jgi:hypothetical protein|nr:hypothetical protein [bacterium]
MPSYRRLGIWTAVVLGAWTGLMLWLCGGVDPLLRGDASASAALTRWRMPDPDKRVLDQRLLYLGDSNCYNQDPASTTPALTDLLAQGIRAGRLGPGWRFESNCAGGRNGRAYAGYAAGLLRLRRLPRAVLIPISLRSLNSLGSNGFAPQAGISPVWPQPHVLPLWPALAPAFARAWWAWSRRFFAGLAELSCGEPPKAAGGGDPGPAWSAQMPDLETKFEVIWGAGYRLDGGVMVALAEAGWHLREAGVTVLFVASPLQMAQIGRECGPMVREQVESGDRQMVKFLRDQGFQVLDLHGSVDRGYFETPKEHLDGPGRRKVAAFLLDWLVHCLDKTPGGSAAAAIAPGPRPC